MSRLARNCYRRNVKLGISRNNYGGESPYAATR
jgi:hypothetical protein